MNLAHALSFWAKSALVESAVLRSALDLDLFAQLPLENDGSLSLAALAEQIGAPVRGTRVLVEPLVGLGLLARDEAGALALRREWATLLRDPGELARLRAAAAWWQPARQLPMALRSGQPVEVAARSWDVLGHYAALFPTDLAAPTTPAEEFYDQVARHFLRTQALIAAAELGLIEPLSTAALSEQQIVTLSGAAPAGLRVLLTTLCQMGFLVTSGDGYCYHPEIAPVLNKRNAKAYAQGLLITAMQWESLGQLSTTISSEQRIFDLGDAQQSSQFYTALARYDISVFPSYFQITRRVPQALGALRSIERLRVLDVGAGSGVWGAAFAHADPTIAVTFLDQPVVLVQTRRNMEKLNLVQQATFLAADFCSHDYGSAAYDVIIMGMICHTQPPELLPDLFARLARALRPNGYLVIAEPVLNEHRDGPLDYLYFAVKEFISTQGNVLSLPEYGRLLAGAGLDAYRCYSQPGVDVILAGRATLTLPEMLGAPGR